MYLNVLPLAGALLLAAPVFAQTPANLLANGNFEADANGDNWPDGWGSARPGVTWENEGGNRFYRMKALEADKITSLYHRVRVPQGVRAFEFSWKERVSDLKVGQLNYYDARVIINPKNAADEIVKGGPNPVYTNKNTDWQNKSIKFLVPEGAVNVDLMPCLFRVQTGTLDLDDLSLVAIDAAPLEAAAKEKAEAQAKKIAAETAKRQANVEKNTGPDGEMLLNGNFQQTGKGDTPDKWDAAEGATTWATEGDNRFLRITAPEPDKMYKYYRRVDLPAGAQALEFKWKQRLAGYQKGKRPEHDARVIVNFKDADGKQIPGPHPAYTQKDTNGWVDKSLSFLIPAGAVSVELMPTLFNVKAGTFDLDELSLKRIDPAPLLALKAQKEAEAKFGNVAPEAPNKAKWPTELRVVGTKVLNKENKEVLLRGVNVPSMGWKPQGEYVLRSFMVAIDDWKSNVIRFPVKAEFWFGQHDSQKDGGVAYRKLIDDCITIAANRGAYTVLDLHSFRAPKQIHVDFWKEAAAKYKDHPTVLFDVYNEPYSITWEVWRDGGMVEDKTGTYSGTDEVAFLNAEEKQVKGFKSVGMQALVNAIRGTGAKNIVIVGGLDYSYDLSGMAKGYTIDEKGGNGMMLSTHIYSQKRDYPGKVLIMADKYPIFVGEFGANTEKFNFMPAASQEDAETWVPKIFGFMQKHGMHYTGWSFHPSAGPKMLKGWDFAPTPEWGGVAKRALGGEKFPYTGMR